VADKTKITCEIHDIKTIPGTKSQLVSIKFKEGDKEWYKAFRVAYDRQVSMEEFTRDLSGMDIYPEEDTDPLLYVREELGKEFTIDVPANAS
jgi:hypothetical protein